jgi:hypothetical protein
MTDVTRLKKKHVHYVACFMEKHSSSQKIRVFTLSSKHQQKKGHYYGWLNTIIP